MLQLLAKFSGRQPGGTACDQVTNGGNQAALSGKADLLVMPNTLAVKLRGISEGVPLAVIGVTPGKVGGSGITSSAERVRVALNHFLKLSDFKIALICSNSSRSFA